MFESAPPVDVIVAPSVEEFAERYVRCERPAVVRGGVKDWPAFNTWTPEHLKAMHGTRQVKIGVATDGVFLDYAERLKLGVDPEVEFAEAIDDIFTPTNAERRCRIHQEPLNHWSVLHKESPPLKYVLRRVVAKNLWMGSTGNLTKTHYDMEDNINVQLIGRKEVILFPSSQLDELYPQSTWQYMSNFSRVEIETPDLSHYPLFSRATPWRAILEPGDFIYIPIYWWHQFYTLEASLNVNFWWQASATQAFRRQGLRYWPRMARDLNLHKHILRTARSAGESLFSR